MNPPPLQTNTKQNLEQMPRPCQFYLRGHCKFMNMKKKKKRCRLNHKIPTCFTQKCSLKCGFRHPKPCKLFQVAGQCPWKQCSYAHNPQPAGMHQSHCPTSVPLQHPVLVLGPVENDNPVTERLKEALDTIQVLQQQVQELTRRFKTTS